MIPNRCLALSCPPFYQIPVWASSFGSHTGPLSLDFIIICFPHYPPSVISKPLMVSEKLLLDSGPVAQMPHTKSTPNCTSLTELPPLLCLHFREGYQARCNPNQRSSTATSIQLSCHHLWLTPVS